MSLQHLLSAIPPPEHPLLPDNPGDLWQAAQQRFGIRLPEDLRQIATHYGLGHFAGVETTFLLAFNPLSPSYLDTIVSEIQVLRDTRKWWGEADVPFLPYPDEDGLFPLGMDDCGTTIWWRISSKSALWPIVVIWETKENGFCEFAMPLTEWLASIVTRRASCPCWPEPWFTDNVCFKPDPHH